MLFSRSILAQQDQNNSEQKKERQSIKGQLRADNLIVQGALAIGEDAVEESFGFDTFRLKENNLQIHFDDTSTFPGFASNDWRIVINDTAEDGANYFGIEDATADRMLFKLSAGAPANAFFMAANGNVGLGTSMPSAKLHIVQGNTPLVRLQQDGSAGWSPQSWDVAGNETNFFIRDNTNGSKLPFKIKPGAPNNALFIATNGNIGLGTSTPNSNASLELNSTSKGLLLNRLTTAEKTSLEGALAVKDVGLVIYDTDKKVLSVWDGTVFTSSTQDLASATLLGNVLEIETENGNAVSVDLSPVLSSLQAELNSQSEMITALVSRIESIEACACAGTLAVQGVQNISSKFLLSQNKPNPFNGETKIDFKIPSHIQKAYIKIYDSNGKTLQKIAIKQRGEGSIIYDNDRFSSGIYYYSLFTDNIKVDTKKMLIENK
jgi:hypothetical protein